MELKECKLFPPLQKYLKDLGYKVYTEVNVCYRPVDVVAEKDGEIICYELKMNCSSTVLKQARGNLTFCNKSYAVVPTNPTQKTLFKCHALHWKIGVIKIENDKCITMLESMVNDSPMNGYIKLENRAEGTEAGKPNLKGSGTGILLVQSVKEYVTQNPKANWNEIYSNVENHYNSANSMSGSLVQWQGFYLSDFKKTLPK